MATYVSQYSTTGFCKFFIIVNYREFFIDLNINKDRAPVSKGFMGALFVTCTAINVPLLSHLRQYLICQLPQAFTSGEVALL